VVRSAQNAFLDGRTFRRETVGLKRGELGRKKT
jgi:hypothetical protein